MKITKINLRMGKGGSGLLAGGSVELDNMIVVRKMAVFKGKNGNPFVSWPSRKTADGKWENVVFPVDRELREAVSRAVRDEYKKLKEEGMRGSGQELRR